MSDSPESDLVRALREKAGNTKEDRFTITHGDVFVGVSYSGGSSSSLSIYTRYDAVAKGEHAAAREGGNYRETAVPQVPVATRPMKIVMRPEAYADKDAKASGINVEHQTGDELFDAAVYVDSPTTDHELLQAVLNEDARRAVLSLFDLGLRRITIDDAHGNVEAYLSEFVVAQGKPDRADLMLDAFSRLASSLPVVRASGQVSAPAPFGCLMGFGGAFAGVLGVAAIPLFFAIASGFDCTEGSADGEGSSLKDGCGAPGVVALVLAFVVGVLAFVVARFFVTARLRGRSDSASRIFRLSIISYALAAEITFLVAAYIGYAVR